MVQSAPSPSLVPWSKGTGNRTALVCIPWAGAGATPFITWAPIIDDAADVYGVRLAGRESRMLEPLPTELDEVVASLAKGVAALDVPRVAIFGQCSGALLALETARALGRFDGGPEVAGLVVASQLPPMLLADDIDTGQDLARLVSAEYLDEPELVELMEIILAADIRLISGYTPSDTPLDVPLTVVCGGRDDLIRLDQLDGWRHETTGPITFHEIAKADHLFAGAAWGELATTVRSALT